MRTVSITDYITVVPQGAPEFSAGEGVEWIPGRESFDFYVKGKVARFGYDIDDEMFIQAAKIRLYGELKSEGFNWGDKVHVTDFVFDEIFRDIEIWG